MKPIINYKRVFNEPYKIYTIVGAFPVGLMFVFVLVFVISALLYYFIPFIHYPIKFLADMFPGGFFYINFGIPALIAYILTKAKKDGKKLHWFFYDYFIWLIFIVFVKKKYNHDEKIKYMQQVVKFQ